MQLTQLSEILKSIGGILHFAVVLYREIRQQIWLWNTKGHTPFVGKGGRQRS